jgi:death-on-curing protein
VLLVRHYRVTFEDAIAAHDLAIVTGGRPGIKSRDDLLSALGRPYTGYYRTIAKKAAALMQSVATNHGFIDGNKRTSILLTILLIENSGYALEALPDENLNKSIDDFVVAIVEEHLSFDEIEVWFKLRVRKAHR